MKMAVIYIGQSASVMIVCSCNIITRGDIEAVIEEILAGDPYAVLTPGLIYHRLGRRGRCCGCFPHVSRILVEHGTAMRERMARGEWTEECPDDVPQRDRPPAA
jgi:bacterioferritin-associated ferredoxin